MTVELPKKLADELRIYANRRQTPLTLRRLFDFGVPLTSETRLRASQFLHYELPIRLAHMAYELQNMPYGLSEMPSARSVLDLYIRSFEQIAHWPHPQSEADHEEFTRMIEAVKNRHSRVVITMAMGILELKKSRPDEDFGDKIQHFLDRFYLSRIGIRMLIGQHSALFHDREGWVGIICDHTSPARVTEEACARACTLCRMTYGTAPEVQVVGQKNLTFTYIPSHLHHMIVELLKNSLRATVEFHGEDAVLPPVKIIIAGGNEDVTIKIADEGGGIPRSGMQKVWTYLYSTATPPTEVPDNELDRLAGYGYGLPITRLYARYFEGDLQLLSMEGFGTDAYLHLNRLGTSEEVLPA